MCSNFESQLCLVETGESNVGHCRGYFSVLEIRQPNHEIVGIKIDFGSILNSFVRH